MRRALPPFVRASALAWTGALAWTAALIWLAALGWAAPVVAQATTAALPSVGPRVAVIDARLGIHSDMTRFVLELSQEVPYRITTHANPYRVHVELPEMTWPSGGAVTAGKGLVQRYRAAVFEPGSLRLTFDTAGPVKVRQAFMLPPRDGHQPRLVLDLERVSTVEFEKLQLGALALAEPPPARTAIKPPALTPALPPQALPAALPAAPMVPPPAARPTPTPEKPLIVIDPGHGGVDPGALGIGGVFEKDITLAMALELRRQLLASGRYRVTLTRDRDVFIRLRDRVAIAREAGADLFVSLHADSISSGSVRGLSVYTLSNKASDREAETLAAKENRADAIAGLNLSAENDQVASILIDLAQRDTMNQSNRFAKLALDHLGRDVKILPSPHRQAGFAVLTAPDVPSILVEMGYLSSPQDANLLNTPAHRAKFAGALTRGVDSYFRWLTAARRP